MLRLVPLLTIAIAGVKCVKFTSDIKELFGNNVYLKEALPKSREASIRSATDLDCCGQWEEQCAWYNEIGSEAHPEKDEFEFAIIHGKAQPNLFQDIFKTSRTPIGNSFLLTGTGKKSPKSNAAVLVSAVISCQRGKGKLSFNYWTTEHTEVRVCTREVGKGKNYIQCSRKFTSGDPGPAVVNDVYGLNNREPFEIVIEASSFDYRFFSQKGGIVAIDCFKYDADLCDAARLHRNDENRVLHDDDAHPWEFQESNKGHDSEDLYERDNKHHTNHEPENDTPQKKHHRSRSPEELESEEETEESESRETLRDFFDSRAQSIQEDIDEQFSRDIKEQEMEHAKKYEDARVRDDRTRARVDSRAASRQSDRSKQNDRSRAVARDTRKSREEDRAEEVGRNRDLKREEERTSRQRDEIRPRSGERDLLRAAVSKQRDDIPIDSIEEGDRKACRAIRCSFDDNSRDLSRVYSCMSRFRRTAWKMGHEDDGKAHLGVQRKYMRGYASIRGPVRDNASFQTDSFELENEAVLEFCYYRASATSQFQIRAKRSGRSEPDKIFDSPPLSLNDYGEWRCPRVPIRRGEYDYLEFEAIGLTNKFQYMGLDEIMILTKDGDPMC